MAVSFLTPVQRDRYGRYTGVVTPDDLAGCFHLSDDDRAQIMRCGDEHSRLGFALQLTTVRYLKRYWAGKAREKALVAIIRKYFADNTGIVSKMTQLWTGSNY